MLSVKRANDDTVEHVAKKHLVPTSEITDRIAEIDEIDKEIARLKDLRTLTKNEVNDLVLSIDVFGKELEAFVFDAYWKMEHILVNPLRELVNQRTGNDENWHRIIAAIVTVTCESCGNEFGRKYQSRSQYKDEHRSRRWKAVLCPECEKQKEDARVRQRTASLSAKRSNLEELRALPYQEYLKTDHWQDTRKRALKRAGFKCQLCSSSGKLHVHHRTYENLGCENNSDLIVLCETCHGKFHNKITETVQ